VFEDNIMAVEVDDMRRVVYWSDSGEIRRVRLNGSDTTMVLETGKLTVTWLHLSRAPFVANV